MLCEEINELLEEDYIFKFLIQSILSLDLNYVICSHKELGQQLIDDIVNKKRLHLSNEELEDVAKNDQQKYKELMKNFGMIVEMFVLKEEKVLQKLNEM